MGPILRSEPSARAPTVGRRCDWFRFQNFDCAVGQLRGGSAFLAQFWSSHPGWNSRGWRCPARGIYHGRWRPI